MSICFIVCIIPLLLSARALQHNHKVTILNTTPGSSSLASEQDNTDKLAVTVQAPGQVWGRWPDQSQQQQAPIDSYYTSILQSFAPPEATSSAVTRAIMAPQYIPVSHPYSSAPSNNPGAQHQQVEQLQPQHNPFSFATYAAGSSNGIVPVFGNNYIRPRPQPTSLMQQNPYSPRNAQQGYGEDHYNHHRHSQSPPIKYEAPSNSATALPQVSGQNKEIISTLVTNGRNEEFGTEVDTLMKAIQAKEQSTKPQQILEQSRSVVSVSRPQHGRTVSPSGLYATNDERNYKLTREASQGPVKHDKGTKRRYQCKIGKCTKSFYQKTHLEIHERAHTGVKPYVSLPEALNFANLLMVLFRNARTRAATAPFLNTVISEYEYLHALR